MPIAEAESGLTLAEDNPWYLLATLHGSSLPAPRREAKNQYAWNRYYASRLTSDEREVLKGRVPQEELTPLTDYELLEWQRLFRERAGDRGINMPDPNDIAELNNVNFIKSCSFSGFIFFECHFYRSHFNSAADFIGSSFMRFTNFAGAIFTVGVNFKKSIFDGVDFESIASSRGGAFFNDTTYAGHANFSHIKLLETVQFHRAVFNKSADFKGAHIGGFFDFREAKISGWAGFQSAKFGAQVLFIDAKLQAPTDFDACRFEKSPPQLDGATLHQRTNWRRVIWPQLQGLELRQVENLTDAYSCLKLEMDKQRRHEDELMFFSKELECRRVEWGAIKGIPILLYGWTCDYGQSFMLPLCWLLNLIIIGFDIMMDLQTNLPWEKALLLSVANCLGNFSFRKEIGELSIATHMFSMFQGTIALILLFLIGLGLRNRFRMK